MAEYKYVLDEKYIAEFCKRYEKESKSPSFKILFLGLLVSIVLMITSLVYRRDLVLFLIPPIVFFGILSYYVRNGMRDHLRKSRYLNREFIVSLTENNYSLADIDGRAELSWSGIEKARRYEDGYLLINKAKGVIWCPDRCLTEGSLDTVEKYVIDNVKDFKHVN